jgi:hypothetical protein
MMSDNMMTQIWARLKKLIQNPKIQPYFVALLIVVFIPSLIFLDSLLFPIPAQLVSSKVSPPDANPMPTNVSPPDVSTMSINDIVELALFERPAFASLDLSVRNLEVSERFGAAGVCYVGAFYSATGRVEAIVDLSDFNSERDVEYDEVQNIIRANVPKPVIRCAIDAATFREESKWGETPLCVPDWNGLRSKAHDLILEAFREEAMSEDLLGFAEEQAELELSRIITGMTNIPTDIVFVETDETRNANRECVSFIDD